MFWDVESSGVERQPSKAITNVRMNITDDQASRAVNTGENSLYRELA